MSATEEISAATAGRRIAALAGHLTPGDGGEHATGLSKQVSCSYTAGFRSKRLYLCKLHQTQS